MRVCEECGTKLPFGRGRKRNDEGKLVCSGCHPDGKGSPGRPVGLHGSKNASYGEVFDGPEGHFGDGTAYHLLCFKCGKGAKVEIEVNGAWQPVCDDDARALGATDEDFTHAASLKQAWNDGISQNMGGNPSPLCAKAQHSGCDGSVASSSEGNIVPGGGECSCDCHMSWNREQHEMVPSLERAASKTASADGKFIEWLYEEGLHEAADFWSRGQDDEFWNVIPADRKDEIVNAVNSVINDTYGFIGSRRAKTASVDKESHITDDPGDRWWWEQMQSAAEERAEERKKKRPVEKAAARKVAHDSGDSETIYHCLAGETRYLTRDGVKTLAETVDTTQMVLTNPGNGGSWVEAHIHEFGEQRLYAVTVQRNKRTKVIHATDGHRWVKSGGDGFVTTMDLKTGDRLPSVLPRSLIGSSTPSPFGIAHGITYGDGTRAAKGSVVRLWGEKDAQLLRYFSESRMTPVKTENAVEGQMVLDLPAFFKDRPSLDESIPYLYGWLAGYFAADGSVSKQGQAILTSASLDDLEFVQTLCLRLGVATYPITEKQRQGYGEVSTLYGMQFINSTLRPNFFLVREHQARYVEAMDRANPERIGWTVVSVEPTDRVETVYCAVVPGTKTFVLEDYLLTGNCPFCGSGQVIGGADGTVECDFCHTRFTVQVQPEMAAMPQTVNGQPQMMPGMPGTPEAASEEQAAPSGPTPAFVPPGGAAGPVVPGGAPGGAPAFIPPQQKAASKASDLVATGRILVTTDGVAIPEESYIRHLAIKFADDREAAIVAVKESRG